MQNKILILLSELEIEKCKSEKLYEVWVIYDYLLVTQTNFIGIAKRREIN